MVQDQAHELYKTPTDAREDRIHSIFGCERVRWERGICEVVQCLARLPSCAFTPIYYCYYYEY